MAKTAAEKQKAYRQRQKDAELGREITRNSNAHGNGNAPNSNESVMVTAEGNAPDIKTSDNTGPLDVYSEERWAYLQGRGYQWAADIQRAMTSNSQGTVIGVPIPGDPAYKGIC